MRIVWVGWGGEIGDVDCGILLMISGIGYKPGPSKKRADA
jgi:hypothetical protein